jgi:hypothetical protein
MRSSRSNARSRGFHSLFSDIGVALSRGCSTAARPDSRRLGPAARCSIAPGLRAVDRGLVGRRARSEAIRAIVANSRARSIRRPLADERDLAYSEPPVGSLHRRGGRDVRAHTLRHRHADVGIDLAGATLRALGCGALPLRTTPTKRRSDTSDSSLLCGEAGILTVAFRLAPSDELADRLFVRVRENVHNESNELAWGAPGTMLAAHAMHAWTGEQRWRDAWSESADELRSRRGADRLWTQHFGDREQRLRRGPRRGRKPARTQRARRTRATSERMLERAVVGAANWPTGEEPDGSIRCSGATAHRGSSSPAASYYRGLFLAGAELTWRRAATEGPGLCHGGRQRLRAPEGLRAHGDGRWLDRARRFAMHALGKSSVRAARAPFSDVGVAPTWPTARPRARFDPRRLGLQQPVGLITPRFSTHSTCGPCGSSAYIRLNRMYASWYRLNSYSSEPSSNHVSRFSGCTSVARA